MVNILWTICIVVVFIIFMIIIDIIRAKPDPEEEKSMKPYVLPIIMSIEDVRHYNNLLVLQKNTRAEIFRMYEKYAALNCHSPERISLHRDGTITKI